MKDNPNNHNGYMKAYHCILDYALQSMPGSCFSVFYYIYRQTIGWNKFVDRISMSQFREYTGLERTCILDSLYKLEESKWIHVSRESPKGKLPYKLFSVGELVWHPTHAYSNPFGIQTGMGKTHAESKRVKRKTHAESKHTKDTLKDTFKNNEEVRLERERLAREFQFKIQDIDRAFDLVCKRACNFTFEDHHALLSEMAKEFELDDIRPVIKATFDSGVDRGHLLSAVHSALFGGKEDVGFGK